MKIGIFGGSFNPPHKTHENLCLYLLEKKIVDKIIFVPTGVKYEYKHNLLPNEERLHMIKLITDKYGAMEVSDYEFKDNVVYTCDTLKHFSELYPEDEIYFICGTDNLSYMDTWKNGEYLLEHYHFIIINRDTDAIDPLLEKYKQYKKNFIVTSFNDSSISSTMVRNLLKEKKQSVIQYLDQDVYKYIVDHNLYLESGNENG